jgi:preprotein translocase SecE subunit
MFIRNTIAELKLVNWLGGNKVIQYTLFVLGFLFIGAIAIILIDRAFLLLRSLVII